MNSKYDIFIFFGERSFLLSSEPFMV